MWSLERGEGLENEVGVLGIQVIGEVMGQNEITKGENTSNI